MSTVQSLYDFLQYRRDIQVNSDDLIHVVNAAVRSISKRLYVLESSWITDQMSVKIFAAKTSYETLTLDVAPSGAWAEGDTVTGATSGVTCEIVTVTTTTSYIVKDRSGSFTLGEVLSNGTYSADQGAAHPTCVSSMAFTASTSVVAGTITDANSWFVDEGFQADMPITTGHATNPGPFRIATVAAGTLTLALTDTVLLATSSSFEINSDAGYGFLPDDFWGMKDKPYISGKKYPLLQLPSVDVALQYTTGDPIYYKVYGNKIYVTPKTGADYTIIADYYKKPTALTASTDSLPYNEMFDDLISEYVVLYFRGATGPQLVELEKLIRDGVDLVVANYDKRAPVTPPGINWDRLMGR